MTVIFLFPMWDKFKNVKHFQKCVGSKLQTAHCSIFKSMGIKIRRTLLHLSHCFDKSHVASFNVSAHRRRTTNFKQAN